MKKEKVMNAKVSVMNSHTQLKIRGATQARYLIVKKLLAKFMATIF